mgnify:FL=1
MGGKEPLKTVCFLISAGLCERCFWDYFFLPSQTEEMIYLGRP